MRTITILTIIICLLTGTVHAQSKKNAGSSGSSGYQTGIGLRFGWDGGLTAKHFIKDDAAIEGILSRAWGYRGFRITGLYEVHRALPNAEGFQWFFGGGAHVGFYDDRYYGYCYGNGYYYDKKGHLHYCNERTLYTVLGIDGIIGVEYKFDSAPFTLGLDLKPYFDVLGYGGHFWDGGFTARYVF